MRSISTPTGCLTSLLPTASMTAASQLLAESPLASTTRTTDAGAGLARRRAGIGPCRALWPRLLAVSVRRRALGLDRRKRRDLEERVDRLREARVQHPPRLGARSRSEQHT